MDTLNFIRRIGKINCDCVKISVNCVLFFISRFYNPNRKLLSAKKLQDED